MPEQAQIEPQGAWGEFVQSHRVGDVVLGTVVQVTSSAAFVDLGGVAGQIHCQDVVWSHGPCFPAVGTSSHFPILGIDPDARKIALGSPIGNWKTWEKIEDRYPVGSHHQGEIITLTSYGAWVRLEQGIEGLLPISALQSMGSVKHPRELLAEGQVVEVTVQSVKRERQEMSLTLG